MTSQLTPSEQELEGHANQAQPNHEEEDANKPKVTYETEEKALLQEPN